VGGVLGAGGSGGVGDATVEGELTMVVGMGNNAALSSVDGVNKATAGGED